MTVPSPNTTASEFAAEQRRQDQAVLAAFKDNLPKLEQLLSPFVCDYEDGIYRFYHQSFKVYNLQDFTSRATELFQSIAQTTDNSLCRRYEEIVTWGPGAKFEMDHNEDWPRRTLQLWKPFFTQNTLWK